MNKVNFEIIYQEVVEAIEDCLLSKSQNKAFNVIVKTRHNAEYKISKWRIFNGVSVTEAENIYKYSDLALLVVANNYVSAIPYDEIVEIYAEATKE